MTFLRAVLLCPVGEPSWVQGLETLSCGGGRQAGEDSGVLLSGSGNVLQLPAGPASACVLVPGRLLGIGQSVLQWGV